MSEAEAPPATHTGPPREDENEPLLAGADADEAGPVFDDLAELDKPEDRKGDHVEKFAAIVSIELCMSTVSSMRCSRRPFRFQCWFVYS